MWAAEEGKLDVIKELLVDDPNLIHTTDQDGYTPLHRACYGNFVDVVDYLIKCGANISAKTQYMWEPLHSCCQWNYYKCALKLIQAGADVNALTEGCN